MKDILYSALNIAEGIIVILLFITSIVRNLDGVPYVLIVVFLILASGVFMFVVLMHFDALGDTLGYLIARYGVVACDLLNLLAAAFLRLLLCYVAFTVTTAFKITALYLLYRENGPESRTPFRDEPPKPKVAELASQSPEAGESDHNFT
eukprot:TRINITY_DN9891_c0_g1_i1.p2 TRINITY_DN9891_c0_g1~~TRINITY_DN9891_c0_g1_i1.p2  ORF type:complete len:149 (+),score=48.03 TRINITY_DN9891_c0_g1_i1:145-591(+)